MADLPPWLQINPVQNMIQAGSAGASAGSTDFRNKISEQETQNQSAEAQQQIQLQKQRQAVEAQSQKLQNNMAWQSAANKYAAQQAYQQAVTGGMDPIQALMEYGPAMGESMSGVGSLSLAQTREKQQNQLPQPVFDTQGQQTGTSYNGKIYPMPKPTNTAGLAAQADTLKTQIDNIQKQILAIDTGPTKADYDPNTARAGVAVRDTLTKQMQQLQQQLTALYQSPAGGGSQPAGATAPTATTETPASATPTPPPRRPLTDEEYRDAIDKANGDTFAAAARSRVLRTYAASVPTAGAAAAPTGKPMIAATLPPTMETNAGGQMTGGIPPTPKTGDVVDGYKFLGGDPADQKSWQQQ